MEKLLKLGYGGSQGNHQDGVNHVSQVNGELRFVAYLLQWHLTEFLSQERAF